LWEDGPIECLSEAINVLAYSPWSNRDEGAVLAVLGAAGDLMSAKAADHVIVRILDTLNNGGEVRTLGSAWSYRWFEIGQPLRVVMRSATVRSHRACADLIAEKFSSCTDSVAEALIRVANGLSVGKVGTRRISRLVRTAIARTDHYSINLLEILGPYSEAAIAELRSRASSGDDSAFRALLVAGSDEHDDYIAFGKSAARTVKQMLFDAAGRDGTVKVSGYANDQLHDLTLAALNTNDNRLWKDVTDALEAGVIEVTQLQRSVRVLAHNFPRLPPHVQRKLRKLAPELRGTTLRISLGHNEFLAAAIHLRIAAGTVPDAKVEALLLSQRRDDPIGLVKTLASWNSRSKFPILSMMVVDPHPRVRSQAAYSLIEHSHRFPDDEERALAVLESALLWDDGCCLPDGAAQGVAAFPSRSLDSLGGRLRQHPLALVRSRLAARALNESV
jgi:hypothetical protein